MAKKEEQKVVGSRPPAYTISADTRWGMLAMMALHRLVMEWDAPFALRSEIESKMREFERWEETHRGDPAA